MNERMGHCCLASAEYVTYRNIRINMRVIADMKVVTGAPRRVCAHSPEAAESGSAMGTFWFVLGLVGRFTVVQLVEAALAQGTTPTASA